MNEALSSVIKLAQRSNRLPGDYIGDNGLLYCGKCHTPKQFEFTTPLLDGAAQRVSALCDCEAEALRQQEEAEKAEKLRQRAAELRKEGMRDKRYHKWTFEIDDRREESISDACQTYVKNWAEVSRKNVWLMFFGSVGTGKTFYAACIANALIDTGIPALMESVPSLLGRVQATGFRDEGTRLFDDIGSYPLAVFDDFGAERNTEYAEEQIFRLIDKRYSSGKPAIITTNLSMADMKNPPSTAMGRVYDRILENSVRIPIVGDSRRKSAARKNHNADARRLGLA